LVLTILEWRKFKVQIKGQVLFKGI
jgi:hypothetical protein